MLRNWSFVLLTVFSCISHISLEKIIYTDGWIPMTHNDIYKQIRSKWIQYPVYITTKPFIDTNESLQSVYRKFDGKNYDQNVKETTEAVTKHLYDRFGEIRNINDRLIMNSTDSRKAKNMLDPLENNINNILVLPEVNLKTRVNRDEEDTTFAESSNTYEVTEETEKLMTTEINNLTEYAGYQYNPPDYENKNLTSTLFKILSKYNINSNDKLHNYDLSLKYKTQNPVINARQVPLPYRHNSLNHLPVDPLLAVFLSNYGFYLPSLYGIKSNYNNLYGYLASNNIHNNKPFGLYKIFSDTDSWN